MSGWKSADTARPAGPCVIAGCDLTGLWQVEGYAAVGEQGGLVAVSGLICQHHYQEINAATPIANWKAP